MDLHLFAVERSWGQEVGGEKPLLCCGSQALSNVQEETHSSARDQVIIAKPPAPTPSRRYRRSLVSKGCFVVSINVICVGIRSSLPKRRYRVVIDYAYVGEALSATAAGEAAGCFVGHDNCAN
jgi:hypothetical protein